jgi:hypothetical protein
MQTKPLTQDKPTVATANPMPGERARKKRPSKITVPEKANPLARLVFAEMKRQNVTYADLEWESGVLISTFKAWRTASRPGLASIEAALGALGWTLVPVPRLDRLSPAILDQLDLVGEHFRTDEETFGAALHAAATWPAHAKEQQALLYRSPAAA